MTAVRLLPALLLGSLSASAQALSASELQRSCRAYTEAPRDDAAAVCRLYVQGYLDGLRSLPPADATTPAPRDESLVERATRTRLSRQQLQRATSGGDTPHCLDAGSPTGEVLGRIAGHLDAQPDAATTSAAEAVHQALVHQFPCRR